MEYCSLLFEQEQLITWEKAVKQGMSVWMSGDSKGKAIKGLLEKKMENIGEYVGNEQGLEDDGQLAMKLMWRGGRAELNECWRDFQGEGKFVP